MLLLTGATGTVGSALLRRLVAEGRPVRCLVRDARRLGSDRVRVQIAAGDLGDPLSLRNALRGVDTVVHAASARRDQPAGSIEELDGVATWRLLRAAERAGVGHFVLLSTLAAAAGAPARHLRAKALAERAAANAEIPTTIAAASLAYAPGSRGLGLLERLAVLPAVPLPGRGEARFQPIWADDLAACLAVLSREAPADGPRRHELAGPEVHTAARIVEIALASFNRPRRVVRVPEPVMRRGLRALEIAAGESAPITWDQAQLMTVPSLSEDGSAGAEALGVEPLPMRVVMGV